MQIKLIGMAVRNFKGLKSFEMDVGGDNAKITAENGVGKTTVYDAFLWLLFGKDSTGRTSFELRPLSQQNKPLKGLVLSVQAELECDGVLHVVKKEHREKVVKKQLRGYEVFCWIDEVPKKVGEFQSWVDELIAEDTFKLLTDLSHFNSKLHWQKRREVLLDIAGEIGTPTGFDDLLAKLNDRTVDEYKKVLAEQKKRYTKERDEINPRIDELQRGLDDYAGAGTPELEQKRLDIQAEIDDLDSQRKELFAKESDRQKAVNRLNGLKAQLVTREAELKADTSGIADLLKQKSDLETMLRRAETTVLEASGLKESCAKVLASEHDKIARATDRLQSLRDERNKISGESPDDTCYACKQTLPADQIDPNKAAHKARLAEIDVQGREAKQEVAVWKDAVKEREAEFKVIGADLEDREVQLTELKDASISAFMKIDSLIEAQPTPEPDDDVEWRKIRIQIAEVKAQIGEPAADQLMAIDTTRMAKEREHTEISKSLAQADRMKMDKARIIELEESEKVLAQKLADLEETLASIDTFKASESSLIEKSVNAKFKYATFKLFKELLNGGFEDCCEATFKGVPFADLSTGQQIFVGVDIVNVLSAHYAVSVPLFVDHAESLTISIEANSQVIQLYAADGIEKLTVETPKASNSKLFA